MQLAAHPVFAGCTRAEIRRIYRAGEDLQIPAGTRLLDEDRIGYWFFAVLDGSLELSKRGRIVGGLTGGGHVGDFAILGFAPQPKTVTALAPTRVFLLGRRELLSLSYQLPSLQLGLYPDLRPGGFQTYVRRLRAEGTAAWKLVPKHRWAAPIQPGALPPSIRVRPSTAASPMTALAAAFLRSAGERVRSVPVRREPLSRRAVALLLVGAALVVGAFLLRFHPPVALIRAAEPIDVAADIRVTGAPVERPTGRYLLTAVSVRRPNLLRAAWSWAAGDRLVSVSTAPTVDRATVRRLAREDFLASQRLAVEVAARHARIDPRSISVRFASRDLAGPSAGLVYALALADMLEPGDLSRQRVIAATGELTPDGLVLPVGFVPIKGTVAREGHATVFLVPVGQDGLARAPGVRVQSVGSFADAFRQLRAN